MMVLYTGVGSMGAPCAGAPMKFLSVIHTIDENFTFAHARASIRMYAWRESPKILWKLVM